jgi:hypothetical protein
MQARTARLPLNQIVRSQSKISISRLIIGFLLCFLALRQASLDIKQISRYLCRKTGHHKSTKLYQIAPILETAGAMQLSVVPRQLTIIKLFFTPIDFKNFRDQSITCSPSAIHVILDHFDPLEDQLLEKSKRDFLAEFKRNGLNPQPTSANQKKIHGMPTRK